MHWLLSIPDTFSLREVIRRSGGHVHPPFRVPSPGTQLCRVECLGTGTTVELTVGRVPSGLVIRTDARLSGQEVEEASQKTWRMLRLEEDLSPFLRLASRSEGLSSVRSWGARLLRGTTLFEDILTAATAEWGTSEIPGYTMTTALVNRLGHPLPSNPTLHTFPDPERVLEGSSLLAGLFGEDAVDRIVAVASAFQDRSYQVDALVRRPLSASELSTKLSHLLPLDSPGLGLVMLLLGRYDFVPTDHIARARLQRYWQSPAEVDEHTVQTFFDRWHPWGGLAYWLWDWRKVKQPRETAAA